MKKIKLFAPHVELRIYVSDEMIKDFQECKKIAAESEFEEFKDCGTCSWDKACIGDTGMCELVSEEQILGG